MNKLSPVVGYQGGKRRLLPRLRPFFPIPKIKLYVEPFVGMGALYLDLRVNGYDGPSTLADENESVTTFWTYVHDKERSEELRNECRKLAELKPSVNLYREFLASDEANEAKRIAIFLWLTNFAYGNVPPWYREKEPGWKGKGTKLTSAEKWGKKFPWEDCCDRLDHICEFTVGKPCEILSNGIPLLLELSSEEGTYVYADPPYCGSHGYKGAASMEYTDYTEPVFKSGASNIVLSESRDLREKLPTGWCSDSDTVTARSSHKGGAIGKRNEWLYVFGDKPVVPDLFAGLTG